MQWLKSRMIKWMCVRRSFDIPMLFVLVLLLVSAVVYFKLKGQNWLQPFLMFVLRAKSEHIFAVFPPFSYLLVLRYFFCIWMFTSSVARSLFLSFSHSVCESLFVSVFSLSLPLFFWHTHTHTHTLWCVVLIATSIDHDTFCYIIMTIIIIMVVVVAVNSFSKCIAAAAAFYVRISASSWGCNIIQKKLYNSKKVAKVMHFMLNHVNEKHVC